MDMVLGISMAPTMVRLVLVEGQNADGVTVEQDEFAVAAAKGLATGAADQVIAAIVGTREGAAAVDDRLTSTGVTWTDPAAAGALRKAIATRRVGGVTLVSPMLAAAALTQSVGHAIGYDRVAMLLVERDSATLAVVEVADGSIVDQHRHALARDRQRGITAELAAMVAGLETRGPRADGLFVVGCDSGGGVDVVAVKAALEGATALEVILPEEPDLALARGAALASANAPLFAASTSALAYSLDPGTGEMNPRALAPAYLDVSGNADLGAGALACDALDDESIRRRGPTLSVGGALAGVSAVAAAVVVVSLTSSVAPRNLSPPAQPRPQAVAPLNQVPPPQAQLPVPGPPPPAAPAPPEAPAPPAPEAAAPPAPPAPPPVVQQVPQTVVNEAPPPPSRHVPTRRPAPPPVAPPPPPPAAPPPPEPAGVPAPPPQYPQDPQYTRPPLTFYIRLPFVPVLIPINPPARPAPPPPGP
jgi:hypothetical protein